MKQIPADELTWTPTRQRRRPPRRLRPLAISMALALLVGVGASVTPTPASASSWSAWTTHWYPARAIDCAKARALLSRKQSTFIGPIPVYNHGCYYPVRTRHRSITMSDYYYDGYATSRTADGVSRSTTTWPGYAWMAQTVQIANTSPIWDAWGMTLTVDIRYNGTVATHNPDTLWCSDHSFIIKVTPITCEVRSSGSSDMLIRFAYDASFIQSGMFFSSQHGGQMHVYGDGEGPFTAWPLR